MKEKHVFRFRMFEDDSLRIRTRSGYPVRFELQENPGELFGYSVCSRKLGIFLCGSTPGEVFAGIQGAVLAGYRRYFGRSNLLPRSERRISREYERRFEEF